MATSKEWQLGRAEAERYERVLVPQILGPMARALVEWAEVHPDDVVLDVGCGTGAAILHAAGRASRGVMVGVDINHAMLEVARERAARSRIAVEWRHGSAFELPMENGSVSLLLSAQAFQFLPDRGRALAESVRVVRPAGRMALSVWAPLDRSPYFAALVEAMSRHVGADTAAGLRAAFGWCDADRVSEELTAAGFRSVRVHEEAVLLPLPPARDFVPRHVAATPMSVAFAGAAPEAREAVVREVEETLDGYAANDGSLEVPFTPLFASGLRPAA